MIRGLIFDFDGLIVDTELPLFEAWQEVYREHGHELPAEEWVKEIGSTGIFDVVDYLEKLYGAPLDEVALRARVRARHIEQVGLQAILPGVVDYLNTARDDGLALAVASSSPHTWVDGHLERLGLRDYFKTTCCRDDVAQVKPDPTLYNLALARLGLFPHEAVVFEDSPNGVLAANRAGIFCVAVPNTLTGKLPLDHADMRLSSMAEMPLAELLRRVKDELARRRDERAQ